MAIAAGVRPPRVAILDGAAANAGAVGSGPDDATLLVSRRLLVCISLVVILVGTALIDCAITLSGLALAIDLLILAPVLAATHGVLRYWLAG